MQKALGSTRRGIRAASLALASSVALTGLAAWVVGELTGPGAGAALSSPSPTPVAAADGGSGDNTPPPSPSTGPASMVPVAAPAITYAPVPSSAVVDTGSGAFLSQTITVVVP